MRKRVALYVRISTFLQSTDMQKREPFEYTSRRTEWEVVKIYEDQATGANPNREMLAELMHDCKRRKIDLVCVWKADQFYGAFG